MTKIFAVYFQIYGLRGQSSEYAFECCREQPGRYDISMSYSSPDVDIVASVVQMDCHRAVCVDFVYCFQCFDVYIFVTSCPILHIS